jgi:hypothetical protein
MNPGVANRAGRRFSLLTAQSLFNSLADEFFIGFGRPFPGDRFYAKEDALLDVYEEQVGVATPTFAPKCCELNYRFNLFDIVCSDFVMQSSSQRMDDRWFY